MEKLIQSLQKAIEEIETLQSKVEDLEQDLYLSRTQAENYERELKELEEKYYN